MNKVLSSFLILFILFSCAPKKKIIIPVYKKYPKKYTQIGYASWYGKKFHGRPTASGEIYNMYKRTAAHKTLPFGTYVLVRNLRNNKKTIVRINDRGPFVKKRIIDLSYRAAKDIGLIGPGIAPVELFVLGKEIGNIRSPLGKRPVVEIRDTERGRFGVQVAAFKDKKNALELVDRLSVIFHNVEIHVNTDRYANPLYRVIVCGANSMGKASVIENKLRDISFKDAFIIGL